MMDGLMNEHTDRTPDWQEGRGVSVGQEQEVVAASGISYFQPLLSDLPGPTGTSVPATKCTTSAPVPCGLSLRSA